MKRFYLTYCEKPILQTVSGELSWSNNILILDKTKTIEEKEFYLKMSIKERWSVRELQRQIDSAYFERFVLSQKPGELVKLEQDKFSIHLDDIHRHLKKDSVVRMTLGKTHKPIKISAYETKLPDKKLIQQRLEKIKLPEKFLKQC